MRGSAAFRASATPGGVLAGPWTRNELWRRARAVPSLDLRFADNKSLTDATTGQNLVTFTRASSGIYVDSQGVIRTAVTNEARFDHNPTTGESLGLLVEEQRTNSMRNNTMVGAVAGTPGTLPTNWSYFTVLTGLTRQVVGAGTENGIAYIDIRVSGTPSAAGSVDILEETASGVAALTGQTWTKSQYLKLVAGSLVGVSSLVTRYNEYTSLSAFISGQTSAALTNPTSAALNTQRTSTTITLNGGATTASVLAFTRIHLSGVAIDFTLRIGLPQLEQGAFATSVIPTSGTAATRAADVASITGSAFSSWYRQDEGTVFTDCSINYTVPGSSFPLAASLNDGTSNNRIENGFLTATLAGYEVITGGAAQVNVYPNAASALSRRLATGYRLNDFAASINGGSINADTSGTVPTVDRLRLGDRTGSPANSLFGTIRRITFWPQRLPNTTLQQITQ